MADSRRINANIREEDEKRPVEEQPPFGVYAVILSSEFWPPFKDEKLEVPEDIRAALEVYCKKYEKLKVRLPRLSCLLHQPPLPSHPCGMGVGLALCLAPSPRRLWCSLSCHGDSRDLGSQQALPQRFLLSATSGLSARVLEGCAWLALLGPFRAASLP